MWRTRLVVCGGLLWLLSALPANADTGTPPPGPQTPPAPIPQVTAPAVEVQPTIGIPPTPPVAVQPERSGSQTGSTTYNGNVPPTPAPTLAPPIGSDNSGTRPPAITQPTAVAPGQNFAPPGPAPSRSRNASGSPPSLQPPASVSSPDASAPPGVTLPDVNTSPGSAAAPSQVVCHAKHHGYADPFLVSPYNGWSTINSYVDHDNPDYRLDGHIVLANGLVGEQSAGQASDFFPSYWVPSLRQYISYDGHNGYDFGLSYAPLNAAGDGTVTFAGWSGDSIYSGYGQMILIDHHNGYVTLYGHLSKLEVKRGDKVTAGEEIAISGSTGNSSGPHLHFSVFHDCQVTDPYGWTGTGEDPLKHFDSEQSQYLWLPGHDPLVLNTPPHWPVFPLGLHISLPKLSARLKRLPHRGMRSVPPIDRLLLLQLPVPSDSHGASAPLALASTEARVTQEAESVTPYLNELQAQGVIESFQVIPAAAAIWVRGRASSTQLEGLPGVASLSGVKPSDLIAAQSGLSHAVLIQLGTQQAPSLWPVGFRSSLHPWRPVLTVSTRHALITGFTLPGKHVIASLRRHGSLAAFGDTTSDPQTGGFVVMLHNGAGRPVEVQPGDSVEVQSAHRSSQVVVNAAQIKARVNSVSGRALANATVPVVLADAQNAVIWRGTTTTNRQGLFTLRFPQTLTAGTQVIATANDAAGDQLSTTAYVPGLQVSVNSSAIRGWTVGNGPLLTLTRAGREIGHRRLHPAPDGTFQVAFTGRHGHTRAILPGDSLQIGSRWHHHSVTVPRLQVLVQAGSRVVHVYGVPGQAVQVIERAPGFHPFVRGIKLAKSGGARLLWFRGVVQPGDTVDGRVLTARGDLVSASAQIQGVVVHIGSSTISGRTRPASTITIRVDNAGVVVTSDERNGTFTAKMVDSLGKPLIIRAGDRVTIRDALGTVVTQVPVVHVMVKGRVVHVHTGSGSPGHRSVSTVLQTQTSMRALPVPRYAGNGRFKTSLPAIAVRGDQLRVDVAVGNGLVFQREYTLQGPRLIESSAPRTKSKSPS